MKKIVILTFILFQSLAFTGQDLSKNEAGKLLDKVVNCLKTGDTATFANMWHLDKTADSYHTKPFDRKDVKVHFNELRTFLDTALKENYKIEDIEVEKQDKSDKDYVAIYKIKAWFKYDDDDFYNKGIGFNVDYISNKWCYRFAPDYSTITSSPKKKN